MNKKLSRWITTIATGATVLAGIPPVLGRVITNTLDPVASLSAHGRIAEGVVLIGCTEHQRVEIEVTFVQGAVVGEGRTHGECTGDLASYPVRVIAHGPADFHPGQAEACAVAVNTEHGKVDDVRQWCRPEGVVLTDE